MTQLKGLIIDSPHIENILSGRKRWEMRTTRAKQRGRIALVKRGSGTVIDVANLVDSRGPLSDQEMRDNQTLHLITPERLLLPEVKKWRYAWVLENARKLVRPVRYQHRPGAVIWVNLDPDVIQTIESTGTV